MPWWGALAGASPVRIPTVDPLRPLKPAIALPNPFWWWGLALGLAVLVPLAWWWWRSRARVEAPSPPPAPLAAPQGQAARVALEGLLGAAWLEAEAGRKGAERHAHAVAALLRAWLGARYGWPAQGLTTHELLGLLAHAGLPEGAYPQAEAVLTRLDLARFGDRPPQAATVREAHAGAAWLIEALGEALVPPLSPEAWARRSEREVAP